MPTTRESLGLPNVTSSVWRIEREDVDKAVQKSGDSTPGPDHIPYKAWRALGEFGVDLLFDALQAISMDGASVLLEEAFACDGDHDFHMGLLCCLPKKRSGTDEVLGDYYAAGNT